MDPIVIGEEYYPGEGVQTDQEILEWIRDNLMTLWHPSRTCKMGTADDPMAVVDSKARVFGVNRLRVVDASAVPFLPPGHPQSTCCKFSASLVRDCTDKLDMLAEKIAEDVLNFDEKTGQDMLRLDL
jgi:choline dehydrogenase-like flavoprotein